MAPVCVMATEYHVSALEEDDYEAAPMWPNPPSKNSINTNV